MGYRINLVEDDLNLNEALTVCLRKEGWDVASFCMGADAREAICQHPDLWILDIILPDIDGYQLLREIKADQIEAPIIIISAKDTDIDRIVGLQLGSDDYIVKPFMHQELILRVKRLLGRAYPNGCGASQNSVCRQVQLFPYIIDEEKRIVLKNSATVHLTAKELDLVLLFVKNKGKMLHRERILCEIWGEDFVGTERVVDDLVRRIRNKMPDLRMETMYGYGYRLI